jgi:regulator of telomere elongation helicase 1
MVILGSREQLCIHEEVSLLRGKVQNNACHLICKTRGKRQCTHYSRVAGIILCAFLLCLNPSTIVLLW